LRWRGDGAGLREAVALPFEATSASWHGLVYVAARLDGLAATRDERVEDEAPLFLRPGTYLEGFALRALGIIRRDDELLATADERFRALGLGWHAAQTERLVAGL
jgi:hypothetical protein